MWARWPMAGGGQAGDDGRTGGRTGGQIGGQTVGGGRRAETREHTSEQQNGPKPESKPYYPTTKCKTQVQFVAAPLNSNLKVVPKHHSSTNKSVGISNCLDLF